MLTRSFTILTLALLAIGFMGACYAGVEPPVRFEAGFAQIG